MPRKSPEIVRCSSSPCTYRELFDAVSDIIYIRDLEGVILDINEAGVRFFGRSKDELIGRPLHCGPVDEDAMSLAQTNLALLESGSDRSTVELVDSHGASALFEVTTSAIRDRAGRPVGAYGIMRAVRLLDRLREVAQPVAASTEETDPFGPSEREDAAHPSDAWLPAADGASDVFPDVPPSPKKPRAR